MKTSNCWPCASPGTSVLPKVVLKAFTTGVPEGSRSASSSAADVSAGVARLSQVYVFKGLQMSTTALPARRSP
jgi:hypothetical protein